MSTITVQAELDLIRSAVLDAKSNPITIDTILARYRHACADASPQRMQDFERAAATILALRAVEASHQRLTGAAKAHYDELDSSDDWCERGQMLLDHDIEGIAEASRAANSALTDGYVVLSQFSREEISDCIDASLPRCSCVPAGKTAPLGGQYRFYLWRELRAQHCAMCAAADERSRVEKALNAGDEVADIVAASIPSK
jgi:hypothetical protein